MKGSILLIEDDLDFQHYIQNVLVQQGYSVKTTAKGITGITLVDEQAPDLVILDLSLPDMQGQSVCNQIRKEHPDIPIIMLTAKTEVSDKVESFASGADDYITKPIVVDEFLARIQARLRKNNVHDQVLQVDDLVVDTQKVEVKRADKIINLTPHEFNLLVYLMQNKNVVLTREMILNRIWSYTLDVESRVVDVYMGYLRKKIDADFDKKLIHSVRGFGYTIKES